VQDTDPLAAWLRFERTRGVGPRTGAGLLAVFGSPAAIFASDRETLAAHAGPALAQALLQPSFRRHRTPDRRHPALARGARHHVLALGEPGYPDCLPRFPIRRCCSI
jgi:DNA processing protein